jgi:molecular chaperone DnaJ
VLKGMGLPRLSGRRRGNQRIVLEVFVPTNLGEEQRELTARLDETLGDDNLAAQHGEGLFGRVRRAFG